MYSYTGYGLTIASEFELPELPTLDLSGREADVRFCWGEVEPVPDSVEGVSGRRIEATSDFCRLTYESIGTFLVEGGDRVVADPLTDDVVKQEFFRRLFENELIGLLLHQRDHLVLHASAVAVDGRGAIFLGPRGAGKSTTAAAFELNDYQILEDDIVAIRFDDGTPMIVPGVPQLRLRPDAAEALGVIDDSVPSSDSWYDKRFLDLDERPDPVPLCRCYVLRDGKRVRLEPIEGPDKILELVSRTQARGLLQDTGRSQAHFAQCSRVTDTAPFQIVERPRDHTVLPEVVAAVVTDLHTDPD